jgi:Zinc finger C-x8-C-x5-C-x3-H type (and similar)
MEEESTSSNPGVCGKTHLDTWDIRVCKKYFTSGCEEGEHCSLKHSSYIKEVVCKYFLMYGKCQKGSSCPFIHEILSQNLPECKNQTGNTKCMNPLCKFKHVTEKEIKECVFYNLGFCKMGKFCKFKHQKKELCKRLRVNGVCNQLGCQEYHLQESEDFKTGMFEEYLEESYYKAGKDTNLIDYRDIYELCFRCMQFGHHPSKCQNPEKSRAVRCYKCMKYGHKSNSCSAQYTEL